MGTFSTTYSTVAAGSAFAPLTPKEPVLCQVTSVWKECFALAHVSIAMMSKDRSTREEAYDPTLGDQKS